MEIVIIQIAQLVEQKIENFLVNGSNPFLNKKIVTQRKSIRLINVKLMVQVHLILIYSLCNVSLM